MGVGLMRSLDINGFLNSGYDGISRASPKLGYVGLQRIWSGHMFRFRAYEEQGWQGFWRVWCQFTRFSDETL